MTFEDDGTGDHVGHGFEGEPESEAFRPPPHPDDRLWRHPSEFRTVGSRPQVSRTHVLEDRRSNSAARTSWLLITLATAIGAVAAVGLSRTLGAHERVVNRTVTEKVALAPEGSPPLAGIGDSETATALADAISPATVQIDGPDQIGSGMVRRDDGIVLTSATVVDHDRDDGREETVPVTLADGTEVMGEILGTDVVTDVAVLRLPAGHYPTAAVSEVGKSRRGADVVVVSGRAGGGTDLTSGVVTSSVWRLQRVDLPTLYGLLQIGTSSASDPDLPGPSEPVPAGGPVIDDRGAVVGMTTSSAVGWAYAIPIDVVTKVADDILSTGRAQHGWLGFHGRDAQVAAAGVVVANVTRDGPVGAHLDDDDVIVALDGIPIPNMAALKAALLLYSPGDEVTVTYHRADSTSPQTTEITLAERPPISLENR